MKQNQTVVFGLGGNLGPVSENIYQAIEMLSAQLGKPLAISKLLHSAPWGYSSPHEFVNAVVVFPATRSLRSCLELGQTIETYFGRTRTANGYADRAMDVDILDYCGRIVDERDMQLPHPRMHLRRFVLEPLAEVFPNWEHPIFKKTAHQLKEELPA